MIKIVIGLVIPFMFTFILKSQYAVVQAQHYEIKRYFKHNLIKKIVLQSFLLILFALSLYVDSFAYWGLFLVSISLNILLINKHKIKITNRVKRFYFVYHILTFLTYVLIPFNLFESLLFLNNFIFLLLILSHVFSCWLENIIINKYKKEAKDIIKDKLVIGITGSYGKTSAKNIVYDMLENVFNVSKTPKSFNTKVGIIKSIRENVSEFDDVFICEYGVDRKKGMDELLKIVKPNITLITEVGPQHLLTFKNIDNIVEEKIKLAKALKENEFAIINNDNKYLNENIKKLRCKVITYGIERDSDVMAKNIIVSKEGSLFDLYIKNKKIKRLRIKLLGMHNILNTLGAIGVLYALNVDLKKISELASKIKPIEHRLELKTIDNVKVIDDSFNSNEKGFKMAVDVLSLMNQEKVVITPGIIEQGSNSDKVNYELGKYMADKIDLAILVEKNAKIIKEGLISQGFKENKIIMKSNFIEAWKIIKKFTDKDNKIILIENDLPSIYLR